jgi:hypothetical protein
MRDNKVTGLLAGLMTLGAATGAFFSTHGLPPRVDPRPDEALGWFMAREALGLLKPGGELAVIARDTAAFKNPATDIQLAGFKAAVRRAGGPTVSIHVFQVNPLRPVEVPTADFIGIISRAPKGSVIVSFMGPPLLTEEQRIGLGEIKPEIIAFCSGSLPDQIDLRALFEKQLLRTAVICRRNPGRSSLEPKDPQGWFDKYFQSAAPGNLAVLAPADNQR